MSSLALMTGSDFWYCAHFRCTCKKKEKVVQSCSCWLNQISKIRSFLSVTISEPYACCYIFFPFIDLDIAMLDKQCQSDAMCRNVLYTFITTIIVVVLCENIRFNAASTDGMIVLLIAYMINPHINLQLYTGFQDCLCVCMRVCVIWFFGVFFSHKWPFGSLISEPAFKKKKHSKLHAHIQAPDKANWHSHHDSVKANRT